VAAVLRFDAALEDFKGVTRSIEVREDQTLVELHEGIQQAFGWLNDHLYSFWLDARSWGSPSTEYTAPVEADEGVATADVLIAKLGLTPGATIAYVFDFGDSWRVALRLKERTEDAGGRYPRVVAAEGEAPPQYPDVDEDEDEEAWLAEWEAADRQAAEVVIAALPQARRAEMPKGAGCRCGRSAASGPECQSIPLLVDGQGGGARVGVSVRRRRALAPRLGRHDFPRRGDGA
jgi:hypothetical protein